MKDEGVPYFSLDGLDRSFYGVVGSVVQIESKHIFRAGQLPRHRYILTDCIRELFKDRGTELSPDLEDIFLSYETGESENCVLLNTIHRHTKDRVVRPIFNYLPSDVKLGSVTMIFRYIEKWSYRDWYDYIQHSGNTKWFFR